jgi:hypothetical protein
MGVLIKKENVERLLHNNTQIKVIDGNTLNDNQQTRMVALRVLSLSICQASVIKAFISLEFTPNAIHPPNAVFVRRR